MLYLSKAGLFLGLMVFSVEIPLYPSNRLAAWKVRRIYIYITLAYNIPAL